MKRLAKGRLITAPSSSKLTLAAFLRPKCNRFLINVGSGAHFVSLKKNDAQNEVCADNKVAEYLSPDRKTFFFNSQKLSEYGSPGVL